MSLSGQRGGGFSLSKPPGLVAAPAPPLLRRWEQWDKFCPAPHCCRPAGSSVPRSPSLPAPLLTRTVAQHLRSSRAGAAARGGGKGTPPHPALPNSGSALTTHWVPLVSCTAWQERSLDSGPGPQRRRGEAFPRGARAGGSRRLWEQQLPYQTLPSRPGAGSGRGAACPRLPKRLSPRQEGQQQPGNSSKGKGPEYFLSLMNTFFYRFFFSLTNKKSI